MFKFVESILDLALSAKSKIIITNMCFILEYKLLVIQGYWEVMIISCALTTYNTAMLFDCQTIGFGHFSFDVQISAT